MTLIRALSAEALKLKRTIALKMVVLAPLAVVLLTLFMASQAPFSTLHGHTRVDAWRALSRVNLQFWGLLMLPMYITLETALIAGLDHTDNQWKALFTRPVPRWTIYVAKLAVIAAMAVASAAILVAGVLAEGTFLHRLDSELGFGAAAPLAVIAGQAAQMTGLAFLFSNHSALGQSSMAVFFRGSRFRNCGYSCKLCHAIGRRTVRRLAAVFSMVTTDASACPASAKYLDGALDLWYRWHHDKRCGVR